MKEESLLTVYILICGKHPPFFFPFPKDKGEYTLYLLEEESIISSKRRGVVL